MNEFLYHRYWRHGVVMQLMFTPTFLLPFHLEKMLQKSSTQSKFLFSQNLLDFSTLPTIWAKTLKVSDDVQDKPRLAAIKLCKENSFLDKATQILINEIVLNHYGFSEKCNEILEKILSNLVYTIEVTRSSLTRHLSMSTICNISKREKIRKALKPHGLKLIKLFIESASGLESQKIQQISAQVEIHGSESLKNQLNEMKVVIFFESDVYSTMVSCVELCDEVPLMTELTKDLISIIKSGIGISTKCVAIMAVIDVVKVVEKNFDKWTKEQSQRPPSATATSRTASIPASSSPPKNKKGKKSSKSTDDESLPYFNGKFMAALFTCLTDPAEAIYRRTISSIVYILKSKATKASTIQNVTSRIVTEYFNKKSQSTNQKQLAKLCLSLPQDILTGRPLSLSYLAKNQEVDSELVGDELKEIINLIGIWEKVWEENTPSEETALRVNLSFIIELCKESVEHETWSTKICGCKTLHNLIESGILDFTDDSENGDQSNIETIKEVLISSIKRQFWKGKKYAIAGLLELNVKSGKYDEADIRLISSQINSSTADSDHILSVKKLVKSVVMPKFYGKFSKELREDFVKWAKGDEEILELIERY